MQASSGTNSFLRPARKELNVASWNVGDLSQSGSQALMAQGLARFDIHVACISGVCMPSAGEVELRSPDGGYHYHLFCSHGSSSEPSAADFVAFAVDHKTKDTILEFKPVSDRLALLRLAAKPIPVSIVAACAPCETDTEAAKLSFYIDLTSLMQTIKRSDVAIVGGDFNAQLGRDRTLPERACIGPFALGERSGNGRRFAEFLLSHRLVVANTYFKHKLCQLETWRSNEHPNLKQVDFVLISKRWGSAPKDARSYWGTDLKAEHALVKVRIKLRLSTEWLDQRRNPASRSNIRNQFYIDLLPDQFAAGPSSNHSDTCGNHS